MIQSVLRTKFSARLLISATRKLQTIFCVREIFDFAGIIRSLARSFIKNQKRFTFITCEI